MTIAQLLDELHEKNVTLSVSGGELVVLGRSQIFETPSLLKLLRENKESLIELIKAEKYAGPKEIENKIPPNLIPEDCQAITPEMLPLAQLTPDDIARIVSKSPGGAANVQDIYPLAPLQEGMLFHYLLETEGDPYLGQALYSFDNRNRLDSFLQALQAVIDRHDILRTAVVWEGLSEPMQVVWRRALIITEEFIFDPAAGAVAEQMRARYSPRRYHLDISQAPMLRVYIAPAERSEDAPESQWLMCLLFHHLAIDHITVDHVTEEVQAHLIGRAERLHAPIPFRNFVAQARLGVSREKHEEFFRKMLADVDEPTAPFGLLSAQGDGSGIEEAAIKLKATLERRLRNCARALSVSVASLCHLAWAQVLARVSGRDDVVFGTVLFGRTHEDAGSSRVLGLFINTLPVRITIRGEGVERGVRKAHKLLADLMEHEHASLALAQRCSGVAAPTPLFSSLFNYRHITRDVEPSPEAASAWLGITPLTVMERTNYPLTLSVNDYGDGLALSTQAVTGFNPKRLCDYMRTALEGLVEALERAPETALTAIDVMPEAERRQVVEEWNATDADYPGEKLIHELFEEQAEMRPHAVALVCEDQSLTYGELNAKANRLAHRLWKLGVKPEASVAICLERGVGLVVAMLATLKAGGAYAPLDKNAPAPRQAFMVEDCRAEIALTSKDLEAPAGAEVTLVNIDTLTLAEESPYNLEIPQDSGTAAYIIYTSGSTGEPKGVIISHRNIGRLTLNNSYASFESDDRMAITSNPAFDASTMEVWAPLLHGGCLVVVPEAVLLDSKALLDLLSREEVSILHLVAGLLSAYADSLAPIFPRLRYLLTGGDAADVGAIARILRGSPPQRLIHCYGPSESTTFATTHEVKEVSPGAKSVPIGRPIANTQIYLLSSYEQPAPIGVAGEIYIGGAGTAHGYLNHAELTAAAFLPDPIGREPGARLYKTGDLGRWLPDGAIEFLGRKDFQVKVRGRRVELGEIEAHLGSHPAVRQCVVVSHQEEGREKLLVAYLVCEAETEPSDKELRDYLVERLPDYMLPSGIIRLEQMPLTANGKVDRRALPIPGGAGAGIGGQYETPIGATEIELARIWADVLKLERVSREDNFFELGGHSLLAITVIERMRREGMHADVRTLFTAPTLRALAETIKDSGGAEAQTPPNLIPEGCQRITPEMLPLIALAQSEIDAVAAMTPGGAANIQDIYPLAPLQEGILFHHLMNAEGDPYLLLSLLGFDTRERLQKFISALQSVIDRHDILRTAVVWEGLAEPTQVVWRKATLRVEEVSLDPEDGAIARQLLTRFDPRSYRLDVRNAPMIRGFAAYDAAEGRWLLLCLNHHLTTDHTTLEIMAREAQAHLSGEVDRLPEPIPFRNFVAQARLGIGQEEHEEFFRKMLGDVDEPTEPFRLNDARGDGSGIEGARLELEMGLSRRLRERARMLGVSAASLCHLAWAMVLARVSGLGNPGSPMSRREDVVFGTVLFGRMQGGAGADRGLGLFINTLPIRIHVNEEGVESSARRVHRLLAELIKHEHASLALAQRCSGIEAPAPVFNALLNYLHSPQQTEVAEAETMSAWTGVRFLGAKDRTNYPLTLSIDDLGDGFALFAQVGAPVDPFRVCDYMRTALEGLVEALERAPETAVRLIEMMPEAERRQVVEEWNATEARYPRYKCIHELFEEQAESGRDTVALVYEEQILTYGELNISANRLARCLRGLGIKAGARVAICMERSVEMVVALLATIKAGAAYVPLDPAYPPERIVYLLKDSAPAVLLTHDASITALSGHSTALPLPILNLDSDAPQWAAQSEYKPDCGGAGSDSRSLAYIIYTSGSTGLPKGVMVEHRSLVNLIGWHMEAFQLTPGKRSSCVSGVGFDALVWEIWPTLCANATLLFPSAATARDPERLLAWWEAQSMDVSFLPTPIAELAFTEGIGNRSLGALLIGGDQLRQMVPSSTTFSVINNYGLTETTVVATSGGLAPSDKPLHIGSPISNTQVYILDANYQPAPISAAGEIYIGGDGVAQGYLNRPEMTAERFLPDPFNGKPQGRLYKTGDLGRRLPGGNIEFLGRNDFQVKIRGYRIELGEIEARLSSHPDVREAVVLAREDGEGDRRLVAYYTGEDVGTEALRSHLATALPEYMTPLAYMHLERLPLTPNGKLDRRALPSPDLMREGERDAYAGPRTLVEEIVVGIFQDVLKLEGVGRREGFFELGGHSLSATQVISRVRNSFGVEIGVRSVFEKPTAEGLAGRIEEMMSAGMKFEAPPLVRISREERFPLSFAQQRLWFIEQLNPGSAVYNIPGSVKLDRGLNLDVLERALNEIVRRHEILRTRFEVEAGEPTQVIDAWEPRSLDVTDLTTLAPEEREAEFRRIAGEEAETGFDLSRGPLLRVKVLKLEEENHLVFYTMHHIVSDGWSMGILIGEVETLYRAYLAGDESPLQELPIQYADYAVWQREYLAGGVSETEVGYWKEQLKDAAVLELPSDRPRPAAPSYRGGVKLIDFGSSMSEGLRRLSQREGATLFMTLMAAFKVVLMRYSGQEDIGVGTAIANRTRKEVEGLIGFFVNTLVMRTDLSGNPGFGELVRREREVALGAYAHQEVPFEKLVEELNPERDLSRNPLFQVMMTLQNVGGQTLELPGVNLSDVGAAVETGGETRTAKFDLTLSFKDFGQELGGIVEYSRELFEAGTIARLINHYKNVLEGIVKDSERLIWSLELLSDRERKQIVEEWNATEADYPAAGSRQEKLIHELFEEQVERNPHAVALVYEEQSLTYAELNAQANRLAHHLRELGVGPESRVAICLERSLEMVVALLATLKAGAAYVPLDPDYPSERLAYMLEDSEPAALLTHGAARSALAESLPPIPRLDLESDETQWIGQSEQNLGRSAAGSDARRLAYIIYTSGSTGLPKGAMNEHQGVLNRLLWMQEAYGLGPGDAVLQKTPFSFDVSVWEFFWPSLYGARLVMAKPGGHKDPAYLARIIREQEITTLHFVPSMLRTFLEIPEARGCCELARVICSGESLPAPLARRFYDLLPESELHNLYGPTEAAIDVTAWNCKDATSSNGIPIGRPVANTSMYILDVEWSPSPIKVAGELYIGGVQVGRGYHRRPEMTAERFLPGPCSREPGERTYKTGDQGWWLPEGTIEFLGRNDYQVKIRGFRIELGEIEARLLGHPNVREAVVAACEDGEGGKRLVAYYTGEKVGIEELRDRLTSALPDYMMPSAYAHLERLPLTPNGKLDRRALPAPDGDAFLRRGYEAPEGETETKLAQIWAETLKLERVGRQDNFFELGGHSLLAMALTERMRREGLQNDIRLLFLSPTLAEFAAAIEDMEVVL